MGRHLIGRLGWNPGKRFGPILAAVEEAQIEGSVSSLEEALAMARSLGEGRRSLEGGAVPGGQTATGNGEE